MNKALNKSSNNLKDRQAGSKDNWGTPGWLYEFLNKRSKFDLDACASSKNYKHENYYSLERDEDSLTLPWAKSTFCNPPYGRRTPAFLKWGLAQAEQDRSSVFLIPARPDTIWFANYVWEASEVWLLKGRLKFETGSDRKEAKDSAPFPTMIVFFDYGNLHRKTGPVFKIIDLKKAKESMNERKTISLADAKRELYAYQSSFGTLFFKKAEAVEEKKVEPST